MRPFNFFRHIFPLRPFRMYRRGRPIVDAFQPDERLYRRHRREHVQSGVILPSALQFPKQGEKTGQSVNRSGFSRPQDALWSENERLNGWGVFQFPASCLPIQLICSNTDRRFTFFPRHVPLARNYAHSEVWCDEIPARRSGYMVPTKIVRKELRAIIQKHSTIIIEAEV